MQIYDLNTEECSVFKYFSGLFMHEKLTIMGMGNRELRMENRDREEVIVMVL